MADAVTTNTIIDNVGYTVVHLTCISDGTGETAVVKVDKSAIAVAEDGAEAASLDILQVRWCIQGFSSVRILWEHTTDDVALCLSGSGYDDFRGTPPDAGYTVKTTGGLKDPRSAGGAGDIVLTSVGAISGATYDITLWLRKNPN